MKIVKKNNLILLLALIILGACNISGTNSPRTSSSVTGTNVLAYATPDDLGICSGLGFSTDEGLNSCVRSRMLTKSAMFRNQISAN
jgi:hypothetical protein